MKLTKVCIDCGVPGEWALIDESGEMLGFVCIECEHKRRLGAALDITDVVNYLRAEADRPSPRHNARPERSPEAAQTGAQNGTSVLGSPGALLQTTRDSTQGDAGHVQNHPDHRH